MNQNSQFLDMKEAGQYLGQSYRWMQRHYVDLILNDVEAFRVPKDSPKGHLMFNRPSLAQYMSNCLIQMIPGGIKI